MLKSLIGIQSSGWFELCYTGGNYRTIKITVLEDPTHFNALCYGDSNGTSVFGVLNPILAWMGPEDKKPSYSAQSATYTIELGNWSSLFIYSQNRKYSVSYT